MAYHIEGQDLVIDGFQAGIADSPYSGLGDMRNVDLISVPGEASVVYATQNTITQAPMTNIPYTVTPSPGPNTSLITYDGVIPIENNTAIIFTNVGGALPTGIVANTAYYVINKTATTFNLSASGQAGHTGESCAGGTSIIVITDTGSGTNTFSTINMAQPKYFAYCNTSPVTPVVLTYLYFLVDSVGRVWHYYNNTQWVYMNNLCSIGAGGELQVQVERGNGLAAWKGYLIWFRSQQFGYLPLFNGGVLQTLDNLTTASIWKPTWSGNIVPARVIFTNIPNDISHECVISKTDDNLYFCNINAIGSVTEVAGKVFSPTDATTYVINKAAVQLPIWEVLQCLGQLQTDILAGSIENLVYSWDRISIGYSPIYLSEYNISKIISSNTTAYFFAGRRGRIFQCNGTQAQLFKKIPDFITGQPNPYFTIGSAITSRNQIYFGLQATDNAGNAITTCGGLWAIDLDSAAIRMVNKMSYNTYAGNVTALQQLFGQPASDGFGLLMGWYTTTGGVDKGLATPYTGGQATIESDLLEVGTFTKPFTPSQIEWKTSVPLVTGESIALYYRTNLNDTYTLIPRINTDSQVSTISDMTQTNFQKAQWIQIKVVLTSTATNPSYCRLTQIRIRDYMGPTYSPVLTQSI